MFDREWKTSWPSLVVVGHLLDRNSEASLRVLCSGTVGAGIGDFVGPHHRMIDRPIDAGIDR